MAVKWLPAQEKNRVISIVSVGEDCSSVFVLTGQPMVNLKQLKPLILIKGASRYDVRIRGGEGVMEKLTY